MNDSAKASTDALEAGIAPDMAGKPAAIVSSTMTID
jgi:hypothetical protein